MGFFKRLANALSSKQYRANPNQVVLSSKQYASLNVGAINAEQVSFFCDSLETGADKQNLQQQLSQSYDISNRDTAIETLDWLRDRGHRVYFDAIKDLVAGQAAGINEANLNEDEKTRTYQYIQNLTEAIKELTEEKYILNKGDLSTKSVVSWDVGRLVMITRSCYEMGYITEEEAWAYIDQAYDKCQATYSDWKDAAAGYIIGRSMWGGVNTSLYGIMGIANGLLKDKESPWLKYPLK